MKTYIVYDLDSMMPVAVGEQTSAETARYCASAATGIFHANLFAEEIDFRAVENCPDCGFTTLRCMCLKMRQQQEKSGGKYNKFVKNCKKIGIVPDSIEEWMKNDDENFPWFDFGPA